jgi:hypothetical protein
MARKGIKSGSEAHISTVKASKRAKSEGQKRLWWRNTTLLQTDWIAYRGHFALASFPL